MKTPKKKDKKSGEGKKKKKYKVRNWKEYNQSLVDRGKLFFWITQEAIDEWNETEKTGKRGRPEEFSSLAIQTAMTLQQVFHLPLRQTEGFINSIFERMKTSLSSPTIPRSLFAEKRSR